MATGIMNNTVDLDTDYAGQVLDVGVVTLGEKFREQMNKCRKEKQNEKVLAAVCALLNSEGGKIKAKIENKDYILERDGIGKDLIDSFRNILQSLHNYLNFRQNNEDFLIFVKPWSLDNSPLQIITLETNLYIRNFSSSVQIKARDALEFLKSIKKSGGRSCLRPELPRDRSCSGLQEECHVETSPAEFFEKNFVLIKKFSFTESTQVEVKSYETPNLLKRLKEILPRTVSAFANTDGGYLFVGLDEKKRQIIGFKPENGLEQIKCAIEEYIHRLPVYHFCEEKKGIKYEVRFIEVHDRPGNVHSYVCALRVDRFCCAVFVKEPDSWHVKEDCVKKFSTEEWVMRMMGVPHGSITSLLAP